MRGKTKRLPYGDQMSLLPGMDDEPVVEAGTKTGGWCFQEPHPDRLYFGDMLVSDYLCSCELAWVVHLSRYLMEFDWSAFEAADHPRGRRPLHPRIIVGLVVYGFGQGVNSLRGLERLASRDLAAIYLCGGVRPDHSTIGNFLLRHGELLQGSLFEQTLVDITDHFGLRFDELSGDGTVVQAWGSHYRALEQEALTARRLVVEHKCRLRPQDKALHAKAAALSEAEAELGRRLEVKDAAGKRGSKTKIHPGEPAAVYQPLKTKAFRFSYKPLILTDRQRFIVRHGVEPSREAKGLEEMLTGVESGTRQPLDCVMLDAGFLSPNLLEFGLANEVDLLIPSGRAESGDGKKKARGGGKIAKSCFRYDETRDCYHCPAGNRLWLAETWVDGLGRRIRRYRCRDGEACGRKETCTDSSRGRTVKRYDSDELKEAMEQVMSQPGAKERYRKRAGMVEPVFGSLKQEQGVQRFRRKGLTKVRLEFAVHALAYNLGRAFRIMGMVVGRVTDPDSDATTCFYFCFIIQGNIIRFT